MRIAVVGSGIAGLSAAWFLCREHEVVLFEADDRLGGHTHTVHVEQRGHSYAVDTGFIVCNDWTYPRFLHLMHRLDVRLRPTSMSFSVRSERTGLEYNGTSLNTLFAQRRNLVSPRFWGMVGDILRFNREATELAKDPHADETTTLAEFLHRRRFSAMFRDHYVVPMGAAIWSAPPSAMQHFPIAFFARFFHNHGMLSVDERPTWHTVVGGSSAYLGPITKPFRDSIRLGAPVVRVRRAEDAVWLKVAGREEERFDHAVLASHCDQTLGMLADPTEHEKAVLGAIPYQENVAILHTDERMMPRRRLAWAAWNYHIPREERARAAVTYDMNILQGLDAPRHFLVTLNREDEIDPARVLRRIVYHHPQYTPQGVAMQRRVPEIQGVRRTWFAGAWCGFGFHEDGVVAALAVAERFGITP
ncbi:MAG: FAD-dependent oxidoreductase [Planctomycetes bacterium]|nr:FAD-dependent oxidoreductase [Planctomycetota bacterium]